MRDKCYHTFKELSGGDGGWNRLIHNEHSVDVTTAMTEVTVVLIVLMLSTEVNLHTLSFLNP